MPEDKKGSGFFADSRKAYAFIVLNAAIALLISYFILDSNIQRQREISETSSAAPEIPDKVKVLIENLKQNPSSPELNIEVGNQLFDIGNYSEAAGYYQRALATDSANVAARIDLAVCFFNIENYSQAIKNMRIALKLSPDNHKGLFNMGVMYMTVGQQDSTRKYWNRLITAFPLSDEAKKAHELMQNM
jgi:tetratricopeptide (TPR) repeat protein